MQYGTRTVWHTTSCQHWDIRRFATICALLPQQVPFLPKRGQEFLVADPTDPSFYWDEYLDSAVKSLKQRFFFYELSLPAYTGYRRTSLNFSMQLDARLTLGAYAESCGDRYEIYVTAGSLLAIEEAAHTICSSDLKLFSNPEVDIWNSTYAGSIKLLTETLKLRSLSSIYTNYSPAFGSFPADKIELIRLHCDRVRIEAAINEPIAPLYAPDSEFEFLHLCFSKLPLSPTRQVFADQFSLLAAAWLISHEDAHRYLGHLHFFGSAVGATDFHELTASYEDKEKQHARRYAELDADSSASMRLVDLVYDVETLGIMFDLMDPKLKAQFWSSDTEANGFGHGQRNFVLRMMVGGAVLPLLLFQINLQQSSKQNTAHYPLLAHRLLNVVFEIFNRAIATQMHKSHQLTGRIETDGEVFNFCLGAICDIQSMYYSLLDSKGQDFLEQYGQLDLGEDQDVFFSKETAAAIAAFLCGIHNIAAVPLMALVTDTPLGRKASRIVVDFMRFKQRALACAVHYFEPPRRVANAGDNLRQEKITEDIRAMKHGIWMLSEILN